MKRMMWKVMLVATLAAGVLLAQGDKTAAPTAEPELPSEFRRQGNTGR